MLVNREEIEIFYLVKDSENFEFRSRRRTRRRKRDNRLRLLLNAMISVFEALRAILFALSNELKQERS